MQLQTVVNLVLFFWLLLVTAYLVVERHRRMSDSLDSQMEQLAKESRQSQELLNILSQELLLLSEQVEAHEVSQQGGQAGAAVSKKVDPVDQVPNPICSRYEEVFQRIAQGQDVADIARELGMGKGEIELIISLGNQINATNHKS